MKIISPIVYQTSAIYFTIGNTISCWRPTISFVLFIGELADGISPSTLTIIMVISTTATLLFIIAIEEVMGVFTIIMDSMQTVVLYGMVVYVEITQLL